MLHNDLHCAAGIIYARRVDMHNHTIVLVQI
jgi:hypothetical protein